MGLPRQDYWSRLPYPPLGDLPSLGIEPESLMSPALAGRFFTTSTTWEGSIINVTLCDLNALSFIKSSGLTNEERE